MNVAPVSEIIDVLVLDRGYWGVSFFKELHEKYRIDTVTVGKSNLNACEDVRSLVALEGKAPVTRRVRSENKKSEVTSCLREILCPSDLVM